MIKKVNIFLEKKKEKFIEKVLLRAINRSHNKKKYNIYLNSEQLPIYCYKIKSIDDYQSFIEYSLLNELEEWYFIPSITKLSKSFIKDNKEYIFTNSKNYIVDIISNDEQILKSEYTNFFIVPKGSVSLFSIEIDQKLWIK